MPWMSCRTRNKGVIFLSFHCDWAQWSLLGRSVVSVMSTENNWPWRGTSGHSPALQSMQALWWARVSGTGFPLPSPCVFLCQSVAINVPPTPPKREAIRLLELRLPPTRPQGITAQNTTQSISSQRQDLRYFVSWKRSLKGLIKITTETHIPIKLSEWYEILTTRFEQSMGQFSPLQFLAALPYVFRDITFRQTTTAHSLFPSHHLSIFQHQSTSLARS